MKNIACRLVFLTIMVKLGFVNAETSIRFNYTAPEIETLCKQAIEKADRAFLAIQNESGPRTFANTALAMDHAIGEFSERTGAMTFLGAVAIDPNVRDQSRDCETKTDQFLVELYTRKPLYQAFDSFSKTEEYKKLGELDKRLVDKILLNFRRTGISLPEEKRNEVLSLQKELIQLQNDFAKAIADYSDYLAVTKEELKGLPQSYIDALEKTGDGKYKVTLSYPHYYPFMENAENASARKRLQSKYSMRAGIENVKRFEKAIAIRARIASLLGYENHAAYVLEERMAKTPGQVMEFLNDLKSRFMPLRKSEMELMSEFKSKDDPKDPKIYNWDLSYYSDKIRKKNFDIDNEKLREYFPLDHVTKAMFDIYQNMLGVRFREVKKPATWHPDVKLYEVLNKGGDRVIASFYMDLFPREGKYTHAAVAGIRYGRGELTNTKDRVTSVSAIMANFSPATKERPSLLSHDEVGTYFHEFGHIMHHALSESKYDWFSGPKVARDFVEAPSQMLENWTWEPKVLEKISRHYRTGKPLPDELVKKLIRSKNFNVAIFNCRQLVLGLFDMTVHTSNPPVDTTQLWKKLQNEIMDIPLNEGGIPHAAIGHFMGGYDAGYYGYLWSEVFSADMFARFKQDGLFSSKTGMDYRKWILASGDTKDADVLLRGFLGRAPSSDAFFESLGLQLTPKKDNK